MAPKPNHPISLCVAFLACLFFSTPAWAGNTLHAFLSLSPDEARTYSPDKISRLVSKALPEMAGKIESGDLSPIEIIPVSSRFTLDDALDASSSMDLDTLFLVFAVDRADRRGPFELVFHHSWKQGERKQLEQMAPYMSQIAAAVREAEPFDMGTLTIRPAEGIPYLGAFVMSTGELLLNPNLVRLYDAVDPDRYARSMRIQLRRLTFQIQKYKWEKSEGYHGLLPGYLAEHFDAFTASGDVSVQIDGEDLTEEPSCGRQTGIFCRLCRSTMVSYIDRVLLGAVDKVMAWGDNRGEATTCASLFFAVGALFLPIVLEPAMEITDEICAPMCETGCRIFQSGEPSILIVISGALLVLPLGFIFYRRMRR